MKLFSCKACLAKEAHIESLQKQIERLESQLFPDNNPLTIPLVHYEADGILSGQQHTVEPTEDELAAEADRILTANF